MRIDLFRMERTQCLYENEVQFNLSESGVLPLRVEELVDDPAEFLSYSLKYPESDGSNELRDHIANWYGARRDEILVTNGGSEANFTALWGLLDPDSHAAIMLPNYLQAWGLSRAYAAKTTTFQLVEHKTNNRWALDIDSLRRAVTKKTKLIVVTNPNNPTGAVLNEEEMSEIIRSARKANAWLLVDEIYRGAEVGDTITPTFWGATTSCSSPPDSRKLLASGPAHRMDSRPSQAHGPTLPLSRLHHTHANVSVRSSRSHRDGARAP